MTTHSLISTERKLILIFVSGALLFLVSFEWIFLLTRTLQENQLQRTNFDHEASITNDRRGDSNRRPGPPSWDRPPQVRQANNNDRPPVDIGYIVIDSSGELLLSRLGGASDIISTEDVLDRNILLGLPIWETVSTGGFLLRKVPNTTAVGGTKIFIGKGGYSFDDMIRDILRFVAMDVLILIPFWFGAQYFIRRTLEPVTKNLDDMTHFIHDAGHELKTPLAIVSGNIQFLRDTKKLDPEILETSLATVHSMAESLDGLLELSQIQWLADKEDCLLAEAVQEILTLHATKLESKKITTIVEIDPRAVIQMNRKHFQILFANLLQNAINYNVPNGKITIVYDKKIFSVQDTGIGIKQENIDKIFNRFFRVDRSGQYPGTGIGLAIVDRILKLYRWNISVESEVGKGTKFAIKMR